MEITKLATTRNASVSGAPGDLAANVACRISSILKKMFPRPVSLHEPCFGGREWEYAKECLDTGWVSSSGKFVDKFENHIAEYTGSRFVTACVNGTAALHMCLKIADIAPDDEILMPWPHISIPPSSASFCPHLKRSE